MSRTRTCATLSALVIGLSLFTVSRSGMSRAQAQSTPDLSGTWELINDNGEKKTSWNKRFPIIKLIITQEASEIRITRKRMKRGKEEVVNYLYYTDGRGETNTGRVWLRPEAPNVESVTKLNEAKIVTEYTKVWVRGAAVYMFAPGGFAKEYWSLGSDGKTLSLTVRSWSTDSGGPTGPGQTSSSLFTRAKYVFRRIS